MKSLTITQIQNRIALLCKNQHVAPVVGACLAIAKQALVTVPEPHLLMMSAHQLRQIANELDALADQAKQETKH